MRRGLPFPIRYSKKEEDGKITYGIMFIGDGTVIESDHRISLSRPDNATIEQIKRRDGYKCVKCGSTEELEVHHIKPLMRARSPIEIAELNKPENLITLCKRCHKKQIH